MKRDDAISNEGNLCTIVESKNIYKLPVLNTNDLFSAHSRSEGKMRYFRCSYSFLCNGVEEFFHMNKQMPKSPYIDTKVQIKLVGGLANYI